MGSKVITSVFYVLMRPWLEHLGVPDIHLGGHDMSAPDIDLLLLFSNLISRNVVFPGRKSHAVQRCSN
jgi:hypothetical protein